MTKSFAKGDVYNKEKTRYRAKQGFPFGRLNDNVWCILCRYTGEIDTDGA